MKALISIFLILALFIQCSDNDAQPKNDPPVLTILSPEPLEEFRQGDLVTISIEANDMDGAISSIVLMIDNVEIGSSTSSPYTYEWNTAEVDFGNCTIGIIVTDNKGDFMEDQIQICIVDDWAESSNFNINNFSGFYNITNISSLGTQTYKAELKVDPDKQNIIYSTNMGNEVAQEHMYSDTYLYFKFHIDGSSAITIPFQEWSATCGRLCSIEGNGTFDHVSGTFNITYKYHVPDYWVGYDFVMVTEEFVP